MHLNRGVIYSGLPAPGGRGRGGILNALSLNPRFAPALLNLANIREDQGRRDEAMELYRQVLEPDPHCALALARYANMQPARACDAKLIASVAGGP